MNSKQLWMCGLLLLSLLVKAQQHIIFHNTFLVESGADKLIPLVITSGNTNYTSSNIPWYHVPYNPFGAMAVFNGNAEFDLHAFVRKDSLAYYRYSVVVNDTNLVTYNAKLTEDISELNRYPSSFFKSVPLYPYLPWRNKQYQYVKIRLGITDVRQKKLTIKLYKLPHILEETTLIIYNKPLHYAEIIKQATVMHDHKPVQLAIKSTDLNVAHKVYLFKKTERNYQIITKLTNNWLNYGDTARVTIFYNGLDLSTGNYELAVSPFMYISRENLHTLPSTARFSFTIPPPPVRYSVKELLLWAAIVLLVTVAVVTLVIFRINKRNRNQLAAVNEAMEHAAGELSYIRSQLNPHFVFNALSGIQYLINGKKVEMANNYLNRFANLTRYILTDKTMISIREERQLLDDYLAMESLRFPFSYSIHTDCTENGGNAGNIEIPVMLLQPLVENAVKHGVSGLKHSGNIQVIFTCTSKELLITVSDNGNGFDINPEDKGLGLKLTRKRIALLNKIYEGCPIHLDLYRDGPLTISRIRLTNWL